MKTRDRVPKINTEGSSPIKKFDPSGKQGSRYLERKPTTPLNLSRKELGTTFLPGRRNHLLGFSLYHHTTNLG